MKTNFITSRMELKSLIPSIDQKKMLKLDDTFIR